MPTWMLVPLFGVFLGSQVGLFAWIGKKFDARLGAVETSLAKMELVLDRGERHDFEIAKLRDQVTALAIELARSVPRGG